MDIRIYCYHMDEIVPANTIMGTSISINNVNVYNHMVQVKEDTYVSFDSGLIIVKNGDIVKFTGYNNNKEPDIYFYPIRL